MSDIKTRVLVSSPQIRRILLARGREASRYRGGLIALLAERTQIPNLAELPTGELVGKMLFLEETTEPLGGIIQGIIAPTPIEEPESHKVARCIMGHHFLGMPEVGKVFGGLSAEAQTALAAIPFSETTLQNRRDTHVLVADLGLSIIDVRGRELLGFYADACYNAQEFATRTSQVSCDSFARRLSRAPRARAGSNSSRSSRRETMCPRRVSWST